MIRATIGLGSNLASPLEQLGQALKSIAAFPDTVLYRHSQIYVTKPWGDVLNQPPFLNAVVMIDTRLSPLALLSALQNIEQTQKRERIEKNGPRTIDCDLLLYGNEIVNLPELLVPHPRMKERAFVLAPLMEIVPNFILPGGENINDLLEKCGQESIIDRIHFP